MSKENDYVFEIAKNSTRGGYYLFAGNMLATVIMSVSSIIIANLLGPENYGLFSLVLSIPSLFIGLADFGITSAITRFIAKNGDSDVKSVVKSGLFFELIVGAAASVLCFIFSDVLARYIINTPEAGFYIRIVSVLILLQTLFETLSAIFIGLDKMENNAVMLILRAITKILLSTLFLFLGFNILGALLGHIACYFIPVGVLLTFLVFKLRKKPDSDKSSSSILKSMLKYGTPLYLSSILVLLVSQYQTIILAFFTSKYAIGNFQVTILFSTVLNIVIYPLDALFPAFSKLDPKSKQLNQVFRRSVKYAALLVVPASLAISVLSNDLVFTFYGTEYGLAPMFVAFYVLINLLTGFGRGVFLFLFNGIGRTDVVLKASLVGLIVFVPLAPLLVSLYGVMGLIAALLVSSICSVIYELINAIKKVNVSLDFVSSAKIYFASAISALLVFLFLTISPFIGIMNLIFGGAIFLFTYLTMLPIIGTLNDTDIDIFKTLFQKIKGIWPIVKLVLVYEKKILAFTKQFTKN